MNARTPAPSLVELGAADIARQVREGAVSAQAVVEAFMERAERVDRRLNALVVRRFDQARAEARETDRRREHGEPLGPLAGVPVTIKDSLDLEGTPSTYGLRHRAGHRADADERHVRRLRAAGAIVLGKTNVAQLLAYVEADNPLHGRTLNPWNVERTCGGSSGGEGAIIAAGGSSLGLGTDIGGSVRFPSNFCGITGIKPTEGRCPDLGEHSFPIGQHAIPSQVGVLARRVEDLALALSAIAAPGAQDGDPVMPLGDSARVDVADLQVGYYTDDDVMASAPAVRRAVREAAAALAAAGARVVEWQPPSPGRAYALAMGIFSADGGAGLRRTLHGDKPHPSIGTLLALANRSHATLRVLGAVLRTAGQPTLAGLTAMLGHTSTDAYWQLVAQQQHYRAAFARAMDDAGIDLILGPGCALPAFRHGATRDLGVGGGHSLLYNVLGYPAGIVPVTRVQPAEETERAASGDMVVKAAIASERGSAGLPVGVQLAARPWREDRLLAAMAAIERGVQASPAYPRTPVEPGA